MINIDPARSAEALLDTLEAIHHRFVTGQPEDTIAYIEAIEDILRANHRPQLAPAWWADAGIWGTSARVAELEDRNSDLEDQLFQLRDENRAA